MAQLGTIKLQTDSGIVDVPVFDIGDSGGSTLEALRVQTDSGIGFVPLVDPADAASPQEAIRVQTDSGVKSVTDSLSAIPDSVIHHWKFEEGSGNVVSDSVGTNNGSLSGPTFDSDAAVGDHSLSFNEGDLVDISNIDLLTGDFAISVWIKTTETNDGAIIAENDSSANAEYRLVIQDGSLRFLSQGNTFTHLASLNDGTFHHVVVTRNGSTLEFYIDNSSVFSDSFSNTTTNNQTTRMGVNGSFTGNDQFSGNIDDMMIADEGFDSSDVNSVYRREN
jgi:hypothetical protein